MKNYYEILEVSENASFEVIEKAYKTLAKKYHPDQNTDNPKSAEERFKEIGEAYDILSNKEKKEDYDKELLAFKENTKSKYTDSDYENLYMHTKELENEIENLKGNQNISGYKGYEDPQDNIDNFTNPVDKVVQNAYSNVHDAYTNKIYNLKYNFQLFKTKLKNFLAIIITILTMIGLFFILWHIPYTRNFFINIYNNNSLIQLLLDPFIK